MVPRAFSISPTAIHDMRRTFITLSLPLLAGLLLLPVLRAGAQDGRAVQADSQTGREKRGTAAADSAAQSRVKARELGAVKVVAARTRAAGYRVTASRTAMKTDTPLRDTPQAATVVTSRFIADQAMQSMADVVRFIPGVTMAQGEGHRDAPIIRGQSSTADFFVDGVRDDAQYLRDLYNVERIEALKGSNAMVFGRGGGGGVINQVRKEASLAPIGALVFEGGSFDHKRGTLDVGRPIGERVAARLNGVYEKSASFRDATHLERRGVTPTATIFAGSGTTVRLDYEYFRDDRVVDRGIPSFRGRPAPTPITTFFGDPAISSARSRVDAGAALIERDFGGGLTLRNRTRVASYDKFYQNVYSGAVDSTGTQVNLQGYNNGTQRTNVFNQTDLTRTAVTGSVKHTLLAGAELSRQNTDNVRNTAYFNGTATSTLVPFVQPRLTAPVAFRQSATDADNHVRADVAALYAQDQVDFSSQWQAVVGVRVDEFSLRFHNNRVAQDLDRSDRLVSPRVGLVFKPVEPASLYASYSVSHLPSSGDQFASLTATTATLEPERFRNYELGAKWDVVPSLSLTGARCRRERSAPRGTSLAPRASSFPHGRSLPATRRSARASGAGRPRRRRGRRCRSCPSTRSRSGTACRSHRRSASDSAPSTRTGRSPPSTTRSRCRRSPGGTRGSSWRCPATRARSSTWRTCSTRATSAPRRATTTSCPARRARCDCRSLRDSDARARRGSRARTG